MLLQLPAQLVRHSSLPLRELPVRPSGAFCEDCAGRLCSSAPGRAVACVCRKLKWALSGSLSIQMGTTEGFCRPDYNLEELKAECSGAHLSKYTARDKRAAALESSTSMHCKRGPCSTFANHSFVFSMMLPPHGSASNWEPIPLRKCCSHVSNQWAKQGGRGV